MNTNKEQIDLSIPSMQSAHCQSIVSNEVSKIEGVEIQQLKAGKLAVLLADQSLKESVISSIEKAGYTVAKDDKNDKTSCSTGCCTH